jgi:hypothetical protein
MYFFSPFFGFIIPYIYIYIIIIIKITGKHIAI